MAKSEIFCVGFDLPGEEFRYFSFHSGASLLDADIVLYAVSLDYDTDFSSSSYQGKLSLSDESSVAKRSGFALVHTSDLFPIVQYLKHKKDAAFSKKVRSCFQNVTRKIIVFPSIPKIKKKAITKQAPAKGRS